MKSRMSVFVLIGLITGSFVLSAQTLNVGKDKVVKVNNRVITLRELEKEYEQRGKLPSPDGSAVTKKSVLESLIDEELLRSEVKTKSIVVDENQVKQMIDYTKEMYKQKMLQANPKFQYSDAEFKAYIENEVKMTYDKFEENIRDNVMVRQFIAKRNEKKIQDVSQKVYSDSKLEEFYDANVSEFVIPKYVELKHIFLTTIDLNSGAKMGETDKQIVRKRIEDINARLLKGESFDTLCELNSEDKESRDRVNPKTKKLDRGYLGILTRKDDVAKKQFGETTFNLLFSLQKGKYSGVVQSEVGFHIFYCVDKKDQSIMPFEEAKQQIINYFRLMDQDKIVKDDFAALIKELRGKASIEYYMNDFKS